MTTVPVQSIQSSINKISTFKSDSTLIQVASSMITSGEVKTTLDFVNKFMFALDSEESFPINIDMLVEEKIYDRRDNAVTKLKKNFTEGTDYQVQNFAPEISGAKEQTKKENRGGHNKKDIRLTVDCFKAMCMISQSTVGKQTQMYYLDLEKIFKKYITMEYNTKIQKKISLLQNTVESVVAEKHALLSSFQLKVLLLYYK